MYMDRNGANEPWYKEPWVWLLIALPMSAVIGGMITLYLAVTTSDGLVVDDYYKHGKAINRVLARDRAAAARRLEARFQIDVAHNRMTLTLQAQDAVLPETLRFSFLHPTRKGYDQRVLLERTGEGRYAGNVAELSRGTWHVQLETEDWRLSGSTQVPQTGPTVLIPAYAESH